jgi:ornithine cyclodeaminase/alanine dehydrogenase-like protein (mu-crystallin family)
MSETAFSEVAFPRGIPDFQSVNVMAILLGLGQKYAAQALEEVLSQWPVGSGESRAGWKADVVVLGTTVEIVLTNSVSYAQYVTAPGGGPPLASTLALAAIQKAKAAFSAEARIVIPTALSNASRR